MAPWCDKWTQILAIIMFSKYEVVNIEFTISSKFFT